jgi:ubiquinone/menaquinone biosynthesis C-methylase UbiE
MTTAYAPQVKADSYDAVEFHPLRIASVTEQLRLLSRFQCRDVLEIGVGKGLIRQFLSIIRTVKYTSFDIADDLKPDFVGSVLEMPFEDNRFDSVLCCQVLEHLRFEDFPRALAEIRRITRKHAFISLPDTRRHFGLSLCFFRYGWRTLELNFRRKVKPEELARDHYWEIGHTPVTSGAAVQKRMSEAGFKIVQKYRLAPFPWHSFFVLQKV